MNTGTDALVAIKHLNGFINRSQLLAVASGLRGEEKQFFIDKMVELAGIVDSMPKTYEQDGLGKNAIVSLHYFTGGCDWYITEKDMGTSEDDAQHQAFGYADIGYGPEAGYISIVELLENGAELDFHFMPRKVCEVEKLAAEL